MDKSPIWSEENQEVKMLILILKLIYWPVAALLVLKIVDNFFLPCALWRQDVLNRETGENGGVSLMPMIDVGCLLILLVLAFFINDGTLYKVKATAIIFCGAIIVSYVTAFIVGVFVGWIRSKM